jgi:uncharacterized protein YuzE
MPDRDTANHAPGSQPLYLRRRDAPVASTAEVGPGAVFIDRDASGAVVGVEVLDPDLAAALRVVARPMAESPNSPTPEGRAGECRIELNYDGTIHAEATRGGIARAIREAVAAERERCAKLADAVADEPRFGSLMTGAAALVATRIRSAHFAAPPPP